MKSIKEYQKAGMGEIMKDYLKLGWTFDKTYEKIILLILTALGMWKLVGFFS